MKSGLKNFLVTLVVLWGCLGSLGFILNRLDLIYYAQGGVSSPIALVFDSPREYSFWSNGFDVTVQTSERSFDIALTGELYGQVKEVFPHSIISNAYLIPGAMFPIIKSAEVGESLKYNFCRTDLFHRVLHVNFKEGEFIEKFTIQVYDNNLILQGKEKSYFMKRTFKCLF